MIVVFRMVVLGYYEARNKPDEVIVDSSLDLATNNAR